jgi:hypothetical protein
MRARTRDNVRKCVRSGVKSKSCRTYGIYRKETADKRPSEGLGPVRLRRSLGMRNQPVGGGRGRSGCGMYAGWATLTALSAGTQDRFFRRLTETPREQVNGPLLVPVRRECSPMGGADRPNLAPLRTFCVREGEPTLVILMPTAARLASLRWRSPGSTHCSRCRGAPWPMLFGRSLLGQSEP